MTTEESNTDSKQSSYIKPESGMPIIKDSLEIAGKTLILLTGICYVVGLIVVNINLSQFRVYSLNLLQLNYVLAGLWTLLPILLAWFFIVGFLNLLSLEIEKRKNSQWKAWKKYLSLAAVVVTAPSICYVLIRSLASYLGFTFGWRWVLVLMLGAFVSIFLIGIGISISKRESYATIKALAETSFATFITVGIFIFYIAVFARGPYGDIPSGLGGGRPNRVQLIVAAENKPHLITAGIKFSGESNQTEPTDLILATDKDLILLPDSTGTAVSIPHNIVQVIIVKR